MRKKIFHIAMLVIGMATLQSCLHDDNEIFDEPAAERLEKAASEAKAVLESAGSGWAMQYYLGEEYDGGGCTYLVKFKDGKADVSLDVAGDASLVTHSSYDVIKDQGPVLTFNTYNELMHLFANPYSDGTTDGGDFEFVIMDVTDSLIELKGRKTGNKMKLIRLPEQTDWEDYLNAILDFEGNMVGSYRVVVDGEAKGLATLDTKSRRLTYTAGDSVSLSMPYCPTPDGFSLPMGMVDNARSFTAQEGGYGLGSTDAADGKSVVLEPFLVPDYVINVLGSSININDEAHTAHYKLNLANGFTYTTDADWLKIEAAEDGLTLSATANNEGHPRMASISISNENGTGSLRVTQVEFEKDVCGTYALMYYDYTGAVAQSVFQMEMDESGEIDMPIQVGGYTLHAKLTWDSDRNALAWESCQNLGTWSSYCVVNVFSGEQYWTSTYTGYLYYAPVAYDDVNGTYAEFSEGTVPGGESISFVYLEACTTYPPSSFAGYVDIMYYPILYKIGGANAAVAASSGARASMLLAPNAYGKMGKKGVKLPHPKFGKKLMLSE